MGNQPGICTCTPEYPDEPACDVHGYFAGAPPMTDHTPSPATDGLREAIERACAAAERNGLWGGIDGGDLRALLAAHPAPLADPAPEAAPYCCEHDSDAHDGSGCLDCPCHLGPPHVGYNPKPTTPADLPVAAGEGATEPADSLDVEGHAPTPVAVSETATSDVGLREDEREALGWAVDRDWQQREHRDDWNDLHAAVERIIAARVAEAGARALREAADDWPREHNTEVFRREAATPMRAKFEPYTVADWLRDRARGLGGAS